MTQISALLLTSLAAYGAPVFALTVLAGAVGLPLPTSLLVLAMGAFSREGALNGLAAAGLGLVGAVLGDSLSYAMGHYGGKRVTARFEKSESFQKAQTCFARFGGLAVFLSRFALTAIALPVNLVAAGSGYRYRRFVFFSIVGEAIWIALYGGLGYIFGEEWEAASAFMTQFGGLLLGAVTLAAGIFLTIKLAKSFTRSSQVIHGMFIKPSYAISQKVKQIELKLGGSQLLRFANMKYVMVGLSLAVVFVMTAGTAA